MNSIPKKTGWLFASAVMLTTTFGCYDQDGDSASGTATTATEEAAPAWDPTEVRQVSHAVNRYAQSVGVDTAQFVLGADVSKADAEKKLRKLFTEIRYGQKPSQFKYQGLPEKMDTTWARSLAMSTNADSVLNALKQMPANGAYTQLLGFYQQLRPTTSADTVRRVWQTLNFYRYLNRFDFDRFVMVNVPAAELTVMERNGQRQMPMQVIVGKPANRTPSFTAYMNEITMYPYWNVPASIAVKEILPKVKRNPSYLDNQNMEVLNQKGKQVDPYSIDWASLSADNFPYRFRQASGCSNSLGLLKFNLTSPFDIYLHDTNARDLFTQTSDRWRSHGCIRLQRPVELANYLLGEPKFDTGYMDRCLINQKPSAVKLPRKMPIFITYNLADIDANGQLRFYKDIYGKG